MKGAAQLSVYYEDLASGSVILTLLLRSLHWDNLIDER